jgi:hypothetical protein
MPCHRRSALVQDAAPGPVPAVMTHPATVCANRRAVCDEAGPLRDAAGVTGAEVLVDAARTLTVVIGHRFPFLEAAQAVLGNPDLAAVTKRGALRQRPQ